MALGYLDRPELTAARFVPDPFRAQPAARMFLTGDLVRQRNDGRLEFLGRFDDQVKLRGFRIELGEIEAALRSQPGIDMAVVVLRPGPQDAAGEVAPAALFAYVAAPQVPPGMRDFKAVELRRALARLVPQHMLPAGIQVLDTLPRTTSGKIDRQALPVPLAAPLALLPTHGTNADTPAAVLTPGERRIAEIWRDVLGVASVDPDANFFELGGHSLLAARMLARIEAAFGTRLGLAVLFRSPTVRALAGMLGTPTAAAVGELEVVPIQAGGSKLPIFAVNNATIYYSLSRRLGNDQPFIGVQITEPERERRLPELSFEAIAAEYARLIRGERPHGPYILMGWCGAGTIVFEIAQQLRAAGEEVRLVVMVDTWAPRYLKRMPRLLALLADFSYRWQWHVGELTSGRLSLRDMLLRNRLAERLGLRRLLSRFARPLPDDPFDWFVRYLAASTAGYEPRQYPGAVQLFHHPGQPSGRFLASDLGWRELVTGELDVEIVPGDHLSMFRDPGAANMAARITAALAAGSVEPLGPEAAGPPLQ